MTNLASTLHSILEHSSRYGKDLPISPLDNPVIGLELLLDTSLFHFFYPHKPRRAALTSNLPRFLLDILGNHIFSGCAQDLHHHF